MRKIIFIFPGLAIVFTLGAVGFLSMQEAVFSGEAKTSLQAFPESAATVEEKILADLPKSFLNGSYISASRQHQPIMAVVIENSPDARPQSGLEQADIVFETLAEGGVTRFLALFQSKEAPKIGPVRSARTYFAQIAQEYDAWLGHSGGSKDGLAFIKEHDVKDLDELSHEKLYWRDKDALQKRGFEHSLFTSTDLLSKYLQVQDASESGTMLDAWVFAEHEAPLADRPQHQTIVVDFSYPAFKVQWDYDRDQNVYVRTMGGDAHKDAESGQQLAVKNVLVQYVTMAAATNYQKNDASAVAVDLSGEGEGVLFRDGLAIPLIWKKESSTKRTQFYTRDGQKVLLNPGPIWVELVEKESVSFIES